MDHGKLSHGSKSLFSRLPISIYREGASENPEKYPSDRAEGANLENPKNIPKNNWKSSWEKRLVGFSINSQMLPRELFQELKFFLEAAAAVQVQMEDKINFGTWIQSPPRPPKGVLLCLDSVRGRPVVRSTRLDLRPLFRPPSWRGRERGAG